MLNLYIDADACPVKEETYKVASRYDLVVFVVANQYLNVPLNSKIRMECVKGSFDAADDWIVEKIELGDVVITSDLLLAGRCVEKNVCTISPKGHEFTEDNIGSALSGREIAEHLRQLGQTSTGPTAMTKTDRSKFLSTLDQIIQRLKRKYPNAN
jgi:uncharacterized protein